MTKVIELTRLGKQWAPQPSRDEKPQFHEHCHGVPYDGLPAPRPCPFCRHIEFGGIVTCGDDGDPDTTYHVQCDHCGAEGPPAESPLAAAQAWNRAAAHQVNQRVAFGDDPESDILIECQHASATLNLLRAGIDSQCIELKEYDMRTGTAMQALWSVEYGLDRIKFLMARLAEQLRAARETPHA